MTPVGTCSLGNLLWTEYGLSIYRDQQSLVLQELPEKAPTGLLPRALDVFVEHDLVDSCKVCSILISSLS